MNNRKEYLKEYKEGYRKENRSVNITLKSEEYKNLVRQSEKQGKKPTTFAKEIVVSFLDGKRPVDNDVKEKLDDMNFILRNVANNINQIAKHSNRIKELRDENQLLEHLRKAYECLEASIVKK